MDFNPNKNRVLRETAKDDDRQNPADFREDQPSDLISKSKLDPSRFKGDVPNHEFELSAEEIKRRADAEAALEARYTALGRSTSRLGLPLDTKLQFQSGRATRNFRGGTLTYNMKSGEVEGLVTSTVKVVYKGLACLGQQRGVGRDEPYVVMSIVQPDPYVDTNEVKVAAYRAPETGTYENVVDGSINTLGSREFWADAPQDVVIHSTVFEHDTGDPEKVRQKIEEALRKGASYAGGALGAAVPAAPDSSGILNDIADWMAGIATEALTDVIGIGDQNLGSSSVVIPYAKWSTGDFPPQQSHNGVTYNYSERCTDGDASYDVWYDVSVIQSTIKI